MVSLMFLFWMYVILFAIIGAMRGWAKELLVTFAVILGLFIIGVMEKFIPFLNQSVTGVARFWFRFILMGALVFFGYQGPNISKLASSGRFVRERLQDVLLGIFLGAINGFLIFGILWFYMHEARYPFPFIKPPDPNDPMGKAALSMIAYLPPSWLGVPIVYFAIALAFAFVLVVFI